MYIYSFLSFFWYVILGLVVLLIVKKNIKSKPELENISTGKDVLFHFGMFIMLTLSISTFLIMLFDTIDRIYPDLFGYNYYGYDSGMPSEQAMMIATLVIVFPLFLVFAFLISKELKKNPLKIDLPIRKAVIYTLLVSSVVSIIATLICTIYNWLLGSTTNSFLLKAVVIVLMSVILFFYFYYSLKRDYAKETYIPRIISLLSLVLVVSGIIWSVNVFGTPTEIRNQKLDSQKLQDINNIKSNIEYSVRQNKALPGSLQDMVNVDRQSLMDKETGEYYVYNPGNLINNTSSSNFSYNICMTFHTSSDKMGQSDSSYYWRAHKSGYQCFNIIDSVNY
ncbi:MAG: DUF5671 domain-containing protein [Candidatus Nomurabacteria bacterium]